METKQFFRRPFDVNVVEVTPDNAEQVAEWCGGTVELGDYKHAKYKIQLPVVKVPGNGPNKGKAVDARIGYFVVEHNGSFRVYRPQQFEQTFHAYVEPREYFHVGDLVRDVENGLEGTVTFVDQVLVNFPGDVNVLFERNQLQRIEEFSEETKERMREIEEMEIGVDKLNALRQAAQDELQNGMTLQGRIEDDTLLPAVKPTEIGGLKMGDPVRVVLEENFYFGETGKVVDLHEDGRRIQVQMDSVYHDEPNWKASFLREELGAEADTKWAQVTNPISDQNGWIGWIVSENDEMNSDLVRVAFRNTDPKCVDKCYSYMPDELERLETVHAVPTYDIPDAVRQ